MAIPVYYISIGSSRGYVVPEDAGIFKFDPDKWGTGSDEIDSFMCAHWLYYRVPDSDPEYFDEFVDEFMDENNNGDGQMINLPHIHYFSLGEDNFFLSKQKFTMEDFKALISELTDGDNSRVINSFTPDQKMDPMISKKLRSVITGSMNKQGTKKDIGILGRNDLSQNVNQNLNEGLVDRWQVIAGIKKDPQ